MTVRFVLIVLVSTFLFSLQVLADEALTLSEGIPVRVLRIQQYEDRMPMIVEPGEPPAPPSRTITLFEFEIEACESVRDEEVQILVENRVQDEKKIQLVEIRPTLASRTCITEPILQSFTLGTSELSRKAPIVISNPMLIEELPPVE